MALYRAAEVANQHGHRYFQLLRSEMTIGTGMMNRGQEGVTLIVRFADSDAEPGACLQRGRHPGPCYTAEATRVLTRLKPRIRDASWRRDRALDESVPLSVADNSGLTRYATLFHFDLTESGAVENCSLIQTDAPAELNARACRDFSTLAHFKPAVGNMGKGIRSTRTMRVVWQRSDLGGPTTIIPLVEGSLAPSTAVVAPVSVPRAASMPATKPIVTAPEASGMKIVPPAKRAFPKDDAIEVVL